MNVVQSKDAVRKHNDDENSGKHCEGDKQEGQRRNLHPKHIKMLIPRYPTHIQVASHRVLPSLFASRGSQSAQLSIAAISSLS